MIEFNQSIELGEVSEIRQTIRELRCNLWSSPGPLEDQRVKASDVEKLLNVIEKLTNLVNAIALRDV